MTTEKDETTPELEEAAQRALNAILDDEGEDEEDEEDAMLGELDGVLAELKKTGNLADYGKIMAVMYCGRALESIARVLYQRLSVG